MHAHRMQHVFLDRYKNDLSWCNIKIPYFHVGVAFISELQVQNISKVFGPRATDALKFMNEGLTKEEAEERTRATIGVHNASFTVKRGETFVIMGLSGSGKSTLLRCLNRIHEPNAGTVHIQGTDVTALPWKDLQHFRREKISMVFQRFALFPHRTVLSNVAYGLEVRGIGQKEREEKARDILSMVGLEGWEDRRPDELSGGMQQRVGIARALAVDPDILLMDEAFSALDPLIRREMQNELIALQDRMQKTIIFVTHDLDEALKLGDRIAVMRAGQIEQIGTPEEIISQPATEYVAAFTAGIDRSKVLTAGAVMKSADPVLRPKDGPKTALKLMRRAGISSIFMVERSGKLLGLLTADAAREASKQNQTDLTTIIDRSVTTVHEDESLSNVVTHSAADTWPLAVVDDENKLKGVLVKGAILAELAHEEAAAEPVEVLANGKTSNVVEDTKHAAI